MAQHATVSQQATPKRHQQQQSKVRPSKIRPTISNDQDTRQQIASKDQKQNNLNPIPAKACSAGDDGFVSSNTSSGSTCETKLNQHPDEPQIAVSKNIATAPHASRTSNQDSQDGKRTLIKNQLYLIEQLQLENADLRNERDQLQLENEELKFQLQMIGASLNQQPQAQQQRQSQQQQPVRATNNNQTTTANATVTVGKSTITSSPEKTVIANNHCRPLQDDEDEAERQQRVEQLYGDDRERVRAAAVVIQRAFRKYQICQRFRTITEQLRYTCNAGTTNPNPGFPTAAIAQSGKERTRRHISKKKTADSSSSTRLLSTSASNVGSPTAPPSNPAATGETAGLTYTAGTTKAAAWESLSQAATRLAARTAAAAGTKQSANSLNKSASVQQVISNNQMTATAINSSNNNTTFARIHNQPQNGSMITSTPAISRQNTNDSALTAAAINFQQLESLRKRQYRVGLNIFNKSPEKGISFLVAHSFIDCSSPYAKASTGYYQSNQLHLIDKHLMQQQATANKANIESCQLCYEEENLKRNVAHFLLQRKGLAKEKIGQYLGNLQEPFNQDVLMYYLQELDFGGMQIDLALRKFSSTFRLPGEAQKIERLVERFAQRYVQCQQVHLGSFNGLIRNGNSNSNPNIPLMQHNQPNNPQQPSTVTNASQQQQQHSPSSNYKNNLMLLSKDEIFILTFAIIMLNTDLHSPSLKPTSRMSASQFVNNLRGIFKSQTISEADLIEIYERVKTNQITTTPDHVTHVMKVQQSLTVNNFQKKVLPNLCVPHRRLVCFCRLFEVYDVNKKERVGQHQREIFLFNDMLLVTKLARRARANTPQTYTYRQSISLQGLYVQLFQSAHYNYGIRLCQRINDETIIMFNARNELDQSRFVDDLSESIAEMDEMVTIKANNIVDTIHLKQQERLKRHLLVHHNNLNGNGHSKSTNDIQVERDEQLDNQQSSVMTSKHVSAPNSNNDSSDSDGGGISLNVNHNNIQMSSSSAATLDMQDEPENFMEPSTPPAGQQKRRIRSKFHSMSNLSSVAELSRDDDNGGGPATNNEIDNASPTIGLHHASNSSQPADLGHNRSGASTTGSNQSQRRSSTSSVHSLDSGLFSSRDVSPNQSS